MISQIPKNNKLTFNTFIEVIYADPFNAEFLIGPLEKQLGTTIGNTMRRVILRYSSGCSITSVQIQNVSHEFSSIPGMKEDIIELLRNLKSLSIDMDHLGSSLIYIYKEGPGIIMAKDIICPPNINIINKNQYLCTLNETGKLHMKMKVETGIGYTPAYYNLKRLNRKNEIPMDVSFSPINHICYHVKHFTFYEELLIHIRTNGSISPIQVVRDSLSFIRTKL